MSGLSFAWSEEEQDAGGRGQAARFGAWAFYLLTGALSIWLFFYLSGLFTTLGSAEGSERHGASAVRLADDSGFGLPTMYLVRGQKAWWTYEVEVEGEGGVRLLISKSIPSPDFIVKAQAIRSTARGRFEIVAPESGFYSFAHELVPIGGLLGGARPGSTTYRLKWGVD